MEFRILGTLEVLDDGRPVDVAGRRQRTLLALLLLNANKVVSSDRLIDGLWGAKPPETAPKVLQNAVSQLRRSLGDNLIVTRSPGYVLQVRADLVDAGRFEALVAAGMDAKTTGNPREAAQILREALSLWRGRPLEEFTYEPFAETEIARLDEMRLRVLEERIEADLALGRHADLVGELEPLVAEHPLRERPREQLMLALYRAGRQAEALAVYQDGRRLLADELGLEPGPALQRLEKQILRQDPTLEAPPLARTRKRLPQPSTAAASRRRRRALVVGLAAFVAGGAALGGAFLFSRGGDSAPPTVPNSLLKIDPETHDVVDVFRAGGDPFEPSVVGDYVFVSSQEDEVLTRVDVRSGEIDTIGRLRTPAGIADGGDGTIWVGSFEGDQVLQLDAGDYQLLRLLQVPSGSEPWFVALGAGSVWVPVNRPASVLRFSARTAELQRRYRANTSSPFALDVAFGEGAVWTVANTSLGTGKLLRVDIAGGGTQTIDVGSYLFGACVGFGAVWVTDFVEISIRDVVPRSAGHVLRIIPATGKLDDVISVGKRPTDVATGAGSVWVANSGERTISEIDPKTNDVVATIPVAFYPSGIAYGHGFIWVSVRPSPDYPF